MKKKIFISHAGTDSEVAINFKGYVETHFLGMCDLFVSSQLDSINAGNTWYTKIMDALLESSLMIGLISPNALARGWIYFEFGAITAQKKQAIPVCFGGVSPGQLPAPISHFQAVSLSDVVHLKHLYEIIAKELGCAPPTIDYADMASKLDYIANKKQAEHFVHKWDQLIKGWNPQAIAFFEGSDLELEIQVPQVADVEFSYFMEICRNERYLTIERTGMGMGTAVGAIAALAKVAKGENFDTYKKITSNF